jgi:hypothetical protein
LPNNKKHTIVGLLFFIGDIIDNHYSSYHESDRWVFSRRGIRPILIWLKIGIELSIATVIIGNHDRLVYRKHLVQGFLNVG